MSPNLVNIVKKYISDPEDSTQASGMDRALTICSSVSIIASVITQTVNWVLLTNNGTPEDDSFRFILLADRVTLVFIFVFVGWYFLLKLERLVRRYSSLKAENEQLAKAMEKAEEVWQDRLDRIMHELSDRKSIDRSIHEFHHHLRDCVDVIDLGISSVRKQLENLERSEGKRLGFEGPILDQVGLETSKVSEVYFLHEHEVRKASYDYIRLALSRIARCVEILAGGNSTAAIKVIQTDARDGKDKIETLARYAKYDADRFKFEKNCDTYNLNCLTDNSHYQILFSPNDNPFIIKFLSQTDSKRSNYKIKIDSAWSGANLEGLPPKAQAFVSIGQSQVVNIRHKLDKVDDKSVYSKDLIYAVLYVDCDVEGAFEYMSDDLLFSFADAFMKVLEYRDRYLTLAELYKQYCLDLKKAESQESA